MAEINDLDIVDDSNTARFPEGMLVSTTNNSARKLEGILARWNKDTNCSITAGGTADAITIAANQTLTAYYNGLEIAFQAAGANTGAVTINVDSLGAKALKHPDGSAMAAGEIASGAKVIAIYDGTNFQIVSYFLDASVGASETAAAASAAAAAADAISTAADVVTTNADVVSTNADAIATAADRVQTGLDAVATAADRVQTGIDAAAAQVAKIEWQGAYNAGTAYALNDAVTYQGSSFINIQAGTGQTPAVGGTAFWDDLANKGTDGAGDVSGPASATDNAIALFDGTTGKLIKDSTYPITAAGAALIDDADASAQRTTLGLVIGTDVQAHDADTAKLDVVQAWTAAQRALQSTVTDGTLDLATAQNFVYTPSGADTLEFSNETAGQSGLIFLTNGSNYAITLGAEIMAPTGAATAVSVTGEYILSYAIEASGGGADTVKLTYATVV